jgi:hypothetical protein
MYIGHFAPFAPARCGLYEAARDMAKADILAGHGVLFFDTGIINDNKQDQPQVGKQDNRAGFSINVSSLNEINNLDVIIAHTGINDNWIVKTEAPIVWVVHGRPLACFRPELMGKNNSFSLYENISKWPRVKKMLYFWPEFTPYWKNVFPDNKLHSLEYPCVDNARFCPDGNKYEFKSKGKYNILLCDSMREDIDNFELVNGLIEAVRQLPGIKIHFFGSLDLPLPNCWNIVLNKLKDLGGLGDIVGRITNIEDVYRSADLVASPNRIITRTIGESILCGTPVLCQQGNKVGTYQCDVAYAKEVVEAVRLFITHKDQNINFVEEMTKLHKLFSFENYSKEMDVIYNDLSHKQNREVYETIKAK